MTKNFNPFAAWLGLNPKIKNPHHFQLLGVSPKLTDPGEIQKAVETGVQKNLARLAKVPAGEHDALVLKMKQRLAIAKKTLLDAKLRESYLDKLKRQVSAQQSAKSDATASAPVPTASPATSSAPPLASKTSQPTTAAIEPPLTPPKSKSSFTPPTLGDPRPEATPQVITSPADQISPTAKQAIPMAVSLNSTVPPDAASASAQFVNADGVLIDEVRIDKKAVRRQKKSKIGLIVGLSMLLMAGAGGLLIFLNLGALMNLAGVDPEKVAAAPGIVTAIEDASVANGPRPIAPLDVIETTELIPGEPEIKLPSIDFETLPELNVEEVMSDPQTELATGRTAERVKEDARRNRERLKALGFDEPEDANTSAATVVTENTDNPPSDNSPSGEIVEFDRLQLARYRRHLERSRRSLYRRDKSTALKTLEIAKDILDEVRPDPEMRFGPEQSPIAALAEETHEIYELIDGFWDQVVASCEAIPPSQEIVASGQTIALVESDLEKFIVRHAGSNITYEYYFCPPSLAVAIAEQGAIPDIPTWSKQLAAFYALNQVDGVDHSDKIDELLKVAEAAGHDCSGIRHFASFEFGSVGKPAEKIEMPGKKEFSEGIAEFREEGDYKDPEKLGQGVAGITAKLLLQIDSPNFEQHVVFLEEARRLAVRAGEAAFTEDAIIELDNFAKIDRANLTCDSYDEIAVGILPDEQRRLLMEQAIPFLKSELGKTAKLKSRQRLAKKLLDLATANGMTDCVLRINQLAN